MNTTTPFNFDYFSWKNFIIIFNYSFIFSNYTLMILTVVAIPKFIMIALIFMHLYGEEDSGILTVTALFPSFFIIIMILFIGLTHPEATTGLPAWCRPGTY